MRSEWNERENAAAYRRFTEHFPMYAQTSRWLVERARLQTARRVLDLCSGTGATTEAILAVVGPDTRVLALDGSAAMQAEARRHCDDPRVRYVRARAEELDRHTDGPVDAVVCNSAIWQTDMPVTLAAVRNVLTPGGRLVFNLEAPSDRAPESQLPGLWDLMRAYAVIDHDFVFRPSGPPRPARSLQDIEQLVADAGLVVEASEILEQEATVQQRRAWLSVPIFSAAFSGLSHQARLDCWTRPTGTYRPAPARLPRQGPGG